MATKLNSLPVPIHNGGAHRIYPWDEWLDGSPWHLIPGEDFTCKLVSIMSGAGIAAQKRGLRVACRRQPDGSVIIQAKPTGSR